MIKLSSKSLILMILVFTILVIFPLRIDAQAEGEPTLNVVREIEVREYGLVKISDSFNLENNNDGGPIEALDIGFPKNFSDAIVRVIGIDENDNRLLIESDEDHESINWLKIKFNQPILSGSVYNFRVQSILTNIIKYEPNLFVFNFPNQPILKIKAQSSNSTIFLPQDSSPDLPQNSRLNMINISGGVGLNEIVRPLYPNSFNVTSFRYSSQQQNILECKSIEKKIIFKPNGEIFAVENYSFSNLGKTLQSFKIDTPDNALDIMLYDAFGPLWPQTQYGVDSVQVTTRYKIFGEGGNFNFRLEYKVPQKDHIEQLDWWGRYRFSIDIPSDENYLIEELKVLLELPNGMIIEEILPKDNLVQDSLDSRLIEYRLESLTPIDPELVIVFDYSYQVFWASVKPLAILVLFEMIAVVLIIAYNMKKPTEVIVRAPLKNIRKFIDLQDQKNEMRYELEKRDEEYIRGSISRHEYQRKRAIVDKRVSQLNRDLNPLKNELRKTSSRYADMVRKIEKAESELEALRVSKFQIRSQYRSGRIVKDAYLSIISDTEKRVDKIRETLDALLITFREEAR